MSDCDGEAANGVEETAELKHWSDMALVRTWNQNYTPSFWALRLFFFLHWSSLRKKKKKRR